jgi:hypothetical protein
VLVLVDGQVKHVVLRTSVSITLVLMVVIVTMMDHHIDVTVSLDGWVKPVILAIIVQVNRANTKVYVLTMEVRLPVAVVHNGLEKHATNIIIVPILLVYMVNAKVMNTHIRVHVHVVGSATHVMKQIIV